MTTLPQADPRPGDYSTGEQAIARATATRMRAAEFLQELRAHPIQQEQRVRDLRASGRYAGVL